MIKVMTQPHTFREDTNSQKYLVPNRNMPPGILYINEEQVSELTIYTDPVTDGFYILNLVFGEMHRLHLISLNEKILLEQTLDKKSKRLANEKSKVHKELETKAAQT